MKKFAKLTFLIIIAGMIQLSCDSVTDADIDNSNNSKSLNSEITHSSEGDEVDIVVDNDNSEWGWVLETGETGTGEFVTGPGTPLIGSGSAHFLLEDLEDGLALIGKLSDGAVPLADIDKLEYNTYQSESGGNQAVALQLNVNYDGGQEWQGRLVFEPYHDGDVVLNEWQTWNTLTQAGWWATGAPGNESCTQDDPCTLSEVLEEYPDAVVRAESELEDASLIIFKAGSGWDTFDGNVDGFTISINDEELVYSFEAEEEDDDENGEDDNEENGDDEDDPEEPGDDPLSIEDCKDGGWEEYGFRNQGQCIRYVNTGKDSREESQDDEEDGDEEENDESEEENDDEGEENATDPATIQDCQNGGWAEYGFRNQGQCIRYVNTGKDSRGEPNDDGEDEDEENGEEDEDENDEEEENNDDNENGENDEGEDGETTTSDAGPSSVKDCRDGGWQDYGFKNQGECVRNVRNGG